MQTHHGTKRTAFVTGASYGIGAASALALARDGCDVAVSDLRPEDLADTVEAITAAGARAVPVALDVRSLASIERAMAEVVEAFGHLDVLVNNAGVPLTRAAADVTEAEWDEVIGVNLKGAFFVTQQMGRHLIAAERPGAIVSIASTHGVIGVAERSTYGISKAGISQMTRMLAIEWAPRGIRVNAVSGGVVDTDALDHFPNREQMLSRSRERTPAGRLVEPTDIADAVAFLCSPQAEMIRGQTIVVDGGFSLPV